jgi:3-methyladenine DNA glycosylase AlkD
MLMQVYETSEKLNTALFLSCINMWNDMRKNYLYHLASNSLPKEYFFIIVLTMNYLKKKKNSSEMAHNNYEGDK